MTTSVTSSLTLEGIGLVTGKPSQVTLTRTAPGSGIRFCANGTWIAASPDFVVDANRGVTLSSEGKMLILVEHFLAACGMTQQLDWDVTVTGAPELPILDGSAMDWVRLIQQAEAVAPLTERITLPEAVSTSLPHKAHVQCHALPSESGLKITCLLDFPHPDLQKRWFSVDSTDSTSVNWLSDIANARTFGFVSELPALQAQGLAKGVSLENTLGLMDDGSYTTPLRMPDECLRHKILDFIGDMTLCGVPVLRMNAHFILMHSGHAAHIDFGRTLQKVLF
jgi:UDP-3-O-[3-hydroxymyristoyl] N-acetylglucosamine deacetylase